jgi:hypothetical protein
MSDEPMNDTQNLDDLIDRALASYAPGEPLPGLERRVLAAVAEEARLEERSGGRAGRMGWPEFAGVWMRLQESRFARLAVAAALLLVAAAVPVRLMTHHPGVTMARLPAAPGAEHGLRLIQAISPPPVSTPVAAKMPQLVVVAGPQQPRPTHQARQDRAQDNEESMAFAPIELSPITIAPIRIPTLNRALNRTPN